MSGIMTVRSALSFLVTTFALASAAHATSGRTFVASTGIDGNTATNCPRSAPCRTFAAANTVTSAAGEIVALDAAGYGPITITNALTINGVDGTAVSVPSGTTAITVTAGAGNKVYLRNLQITGVGASNTTGIVVNSGDLVVHNSTIRNLTNGIIDNNSPVLLSYTQVINNTTGITTNGTGVNTGAFPQHGPTWVMLYWGSVAFNQTAFLVNSPGQVSGQPNFTILAQTLGSPITTLLLGNATFMTGTGAECASNACSAVGQFTQQTNQNLVSP